jgi:CheY-like chemotaxis protein
MTYIPPKQEQIWYEDANRVFLSISVTDTGCGLNEDEKRVLFQRFSQASVRTHTRYGGSGLGLYICRELVDLQGGQIGVTSQKGVGSTFSFFISASRPELQHISQANSPNMTQVRLPTRLSDMQNSTEMVHGQENRVHDTAHEVLLVEDNLVNQRVLAKQLRAQNCIVHIANHGEEALDFIKTTQLWADRSNESVLLSVILMDIEMPVMNGLLCMREIRRLQGSGQISKHIPIIATTANARREQISQALEAGAVSFSRQFRNLSSTETSRMM